MSLCPTAIRDTAAVSPVLDAIGAPVVHCGDVGTGTKTKLFTNLLLGTLMQAYAKALVFGDEHGLSLDYMRDVIASSPVGAPLFEYKGPSWRTATSRSNSPSTSY